MKIRGWLGPDVDLVFMGRLLAGLYEQPNAHVSLGIGAWLLHPYSMAVEVDGLKIGIELSDHSDFWDAELLAWCDVYAKRSLHPAHAGSMPQKTIPLGLHCAGRSSRGLLALLGTSVAANGGKLSRRRLRDFYRYFASAPWREYEYPPEQPVRSSILFQTRVWESQDMPGDEGINEQRVALLRALRGEFRDRLVGGLVGNAYALKNYPDLVTRQPTRQPQYIRWAKEPAIGVYSRGLFGSIAFKMAEFMASSKCVVSEPVENATPGSLPLLTYRTNDECIAQCAELLGNPQRMQRHRQESWQYYTDYVRPAALIGRVIESSRARASRERLQG